MNDFWLVPPATADQRVEACDIESLTFFQFAVHAPSCIVVA